MENSESKENLNLDDRERLFREKLDQLIEKEGVEIYPHLLSFVEDYVNEIAKACRSRWERFAVSIPKSHSLYAAIEIWPWNPKIQTAFKKLKDVHKHFGEVTFLQQSMIVEIVFNYKVDE